MRKQGMAVAAATESAARKQLPEPHSALAPPLSHCELHGPQVPPVLYCWLPGPGLGYSFPGEGHIWERSDLWKPVILTDPGKCLKSSLSSSLFPGL